jgi:hypothetical protein
MSGIHTLALSSCGPEQWSSVLRYSIVGVYLDAKLTEMQSEKDDCEHQ